MSEEKEIPQKKINWTSEKIMSTSALFISVISVIALIYQSYLAREENKLIQTQQSAAVLPHLNQWVSNYNDSFKFVIGNKGVGPAFIDDVKILLDSTQEFNNTKDLFRHVFTHTKGLDTIAYTQSTLIKGFVLPANQQINILEINNPNHIRLVTRALSNYQILYKILYRDVYGTQWVLSNYNQNKNSASIPVLIKD